MRFWLDTLGLEVAADWSDNRRSAAALKLGDSHVLVAGQEEQRDRDAGFPIEHGRVYMYVQVRGLDALVSHRKSMNVTDLHGPVRLDWGPRLATARDTDEILLVFIEGEADSALVARHLHGK